MIPALSKPLVHYEIRYVRHLCAMLEKKSYDDWLACFNQRPYKSDMTIHWDRMLWGREIQVEIEFVEVTDECIHILASVDVMPDLDADILPDSEERANLFSQLFSQAYQPKQSTCSNFLIYKSPEQHYQ